MVQLILDVDGENITLPESIKGGYNTYPQPLASSVEMISGRTIKEVRGNIQVIEYQFGYFPHEELTRILDVCKKGTINTINCSFLPQSSEQELSTAEFHVSSYTPPKFMWSREGKPLWGDFHLTLRSVFPFD